MGFTGGTLALPRLRLILSLWIVFSGSLSLGKIRYVLDFDGTIVNDHGPGSGWKTYWILKRVDNYYTSLQLSSGENADPPPEIQISFAEYQRLLPLLAKDNRLLGDLRPVPLDVDPLYPRRPREIVPGHYRVSDDVTFTHFRAHAEGKSFLLTDYANAKKREKISGRGFRWRGPAFSLLQAATSHENEWDSLVISTARYQPGEDFDALFAAMKRDGFIRTLPKAKGGVLRRPRYHFLNSPESVVFGRGLIEKKVKVIAEEATQLLNGPFEPHPELSPDEYDARAGTTEMRHTLIVAEDDPGIVEALARKLEALSSDLHFGHRLKFVLVNVGDAAEVEGARWPWRWSVFDRGFAREALIDEVKLWTRQSSDENCAALIAGRFAEVTP